MGDGSGRTCDDPGEGLRHEVKRAVLPQGAAVPKPRVCAVDQLRVPFLELMALSHDLLEVHF